MNLDKATLRKTDPLCDQETHDGERVPGSGLRSPPLDKAPHLVPPYLDMSLRTLRISDKTPTACVMI
jgi:hypothetical protein